MATFDAIVFDMDGTLLDSTPAVTSAYRQAVLAGGGPEWSDAGIVAAYPLGHPRIMLSHLLGRAAADDDVDRYHSFLSGYETEIALYAGIREALTELAAPGRLGVSTGASAVAAGLLLERTRLIGFFDVVVGGDEVRNQKPSPDGVLRACASLGVPAARAAYVGDSPLDLEAARRSGATAVAAAWGHQYDPAAAADLTAAHPRDLLAFASWR
ncbi:MAG: hypothetical protein QOG49_1537 [Frankiaceae bacterium]|nr:hypothetical protein [Frankiaceae bacterium]